MMSGDIFTIITAWQDTTLRLSLTSSAMVDGTGAEKPCVE